MTEKPIDFSSITDYENKTLSASALAQRMLNIMGAQNKPAGVGDISDTDIDQAFNTLQLHEEDYLKSLSIELQKQIFARLTNLKEKEGKEMLELIELALESTTKILQTKLTNYNLDEIKKIDDYLVKAKSFIKDRLLIK